MLTSFRRPTARSLPTSTKPKRTPKSQPKPPAPLKLGDVATCRRGPRAGLPKQPKRDKTCHLYTDDLLRIANAHDCAEALGIEWGVFVTILRTHLQGSAMGDLPALQDRVFQALRRYCKAHSLPKLEFLWVRECQHRKLDHLHVLTTIPDAHYKAVEAAVTAMGFSDGGVVAKPSGNPFKLMRYFAKQLDPNLVTWDGAEWFRLRDYIGLDERSEDRPLGGRRSGNSHGVGPGAQAKVGFKPHKSIEDLREFFAGTRDSQKTAKRRGWDAGAPDQANSYGNLKRPHLVAANDNDEALKDAA